jgi:hypothetical protein
MNFFTKFLVLFLSLVSLISYSQDIHNVQYTWISPLYGIKKEFKLNIGNKELLITINSDSLHTKTKRISNNKIDQIITLLNASALDKIPDSTIVGFDGTLYYLLIIYSNGKKRQFRAWSDERVEQFLSISNYFESYSPLKRKDYPDYKNIDFIKL